MFNENGPAYVTEPAEGEGLFTRDFLDFLKDKRLSLVPVTLFEGERIDWEAAYSLLCNRSPAFQRAGLSPGALHRAFRDTTLNSVTKDLRETEDYLDDYFEPSDWEHKCAAVGVLVRVFGLKVEKARESVTDEDLDAENARVDQDPIDLSSDGDDIEEEWTVERMRQYKPLSDTRVLHVGYHNLHLPRSSKDVYFDGDDALARGAQWLHENAPPDLFSFMAERPETKLGKLEFFKRVRTIKTTAEIYTLTMQSDPEKYRVVFEWLPVEPPLKRTK